jgi:tetratricopeptide (TPR) repeat protein
MKNTIYLIFTLFSISNCYSQTADVYYNRGNSKHQLEDYSGAIADYSKAIEIKPDFADAYCNRGFLNVNSKII